MEKAYTIGQLNTALGENGFEDEDELIHSDKLSQIDYTKFWDTDKIYDSLFDSDHSAVYTNKGRSFWNHVVSRIK